MRATENLARKLKIDERAIRAAVAVEDGGGDSPSFNFETKKVEINCNVYANGKTIQVLSGVYDAAVCTYENQEAVQSAIREQFGSDGWVSVNIPNDNDFFGSLHDSAEETCILETQVGEITKIPSVKATLLYNSDDDAYYLTTSDNSVYIDFYPDWIENQSTLYICK